MKKRPEYIGSTERATKCSYGSDGMVLSSEQTFEPGQVPMWAARLSRYDQRDSGCRAPAIKSVDIGTKICRRRAIAWRYIYI